MAGTLEVSLVADGSAVRVERRRDVDGNAWLQIRALFNADGRTADRLVDIPLERFMSQRVLFVERCRSFGLGLDADAGVVELVKAQKDARQHLNAALKTAHHLSADEVAQLVSDSRSTRTMRPFQVRDLQTLLDRDNGANFSVPGAGKTAVTMTVYEAERLCGRVDRLLVIAPISAFGAWEEEADEYMSPAPRVLRFDGQHIPESAEVVLTNYQRLAASYAGLSAWVRAHKVHVVLDEAHRMKRGWSGQWGTACLNLAYQAARRDILTGTPAPQHPSDFTALVDFIWPNEAIRILPPDIGARRPAADIGQRVATAIRPLFVRTSKGELDLPPVLKSVVRVPLEGLQADIYRALRDRYRGTLKMSSREALDFAAMGRITMYLLEAATNPKLLAAGGDSELDVFRHPPLEIEPGSNLAQLIEQYNVHETPRKLVELMQLMKENADQDRKTLVWSNFVRNLTMLERMLSRYQPAMIHGAVPYASPDPDERTRKSELKRFREDPDCRVLLANPAAMAEGVSLHHSCHDAVYLDRTFNAGQYLQSIDRIHRLGLEPDQETRITFLITADTVDEVVDQRVRVKAERLGDMLDDPDFAIVALPDDDDYGDVIDEREDVEALFAHLRGDDER